VNLDHKLHMNRVVDGTSNTLMVAEARVHLPNMTGNIGTACCSDNEPWVNSGWGDDVVRMGASPPAPDITDTAIDPAQADNMFGSSHPGGLNACLADGSVRFVKFSVPATTFRNLCVRNDGQVINVNDL
jgi:prepilin-type processing-associated H-X9-DG protein